jgi:hypothetical protein
MVITTPTLSEVVDAAKERLDELFLYVAVGDDDTVPAEGQTVLGAETYRVARFDSDTTTFADEITVSGEIGFGNNNGETIREVAWFDEASGGQMLSRDLLVTEIVKTSDISVVFPKKVVVEAVEVEAS